MIERARKLDFMLVSGTGLRLADVDNLRLNITEKQVKSLVNGSRTRQKTNVNEAISEGADTDSSVDFLVVHVVF